MEKSFFDFLPPELIAHIQVYVDKDFLNSWCTLISYCNDRIYWKYFYSYLTPDWKLILDNKDVNLSYLNQYKKLLSLKNEDIFQSAGELDSVVYLISIKKVNIDIGRGSDAGTLLIRASWKGHLEVVKYLVKKGANINEQSEDRLTSLMAASNWGYLKMVKYLIERGAKVDRQDIFGKTALMRASDLGSLEIIKYLIENGASVDKQDIDGKTALDIASEEERLDVVEYLQSLDK